MIGEIKWFSTNRGYGFVTGEDGTDYFLHHKSLGPEFEDRPDSGFMTIQEGTAVEFDLQDDPKGPIAVNVKRI